MRSSPSMCSMAGFSGKRRQQPTGFKRGRLGFKSCPHESKTSGTPAPIAFHACDPGYGQTTLGFLTTLSNKPALLKLTRSPI